MAALMIQGCGSDVGKSLLVAGLCRLFTNKGLHVRPFKPQNMSNNAAVTADGGEIGRAQALQARACRVEPTTSMNPVLLKPEGDRRSQLIVRGRRAGIVRPRDFVKSREDLLRTVLECYRELQRECDLVLVEGAGSPAETNLRAHDIANMGFAHAANVPVLLAGDISRGHVIASLVGAHAVLDERDRSRVHGFIINKFRGDAALFADGIVNIERMTGWKSFGIVPWMLSAATLPAEDAASLATESKLASAMDKPRIGILRVPHLANFDDFDPLMLEPAVHVQYINPGMPLPGNLSLLIIPGTKATLADLEFVREQGWDVDIHAHVRRGGHVLGICGGYQMLGAELHDPAGLEGGPRHARGLGLLAVTTTLGSSKHLRRVSGRLMEGGAEFSGYEMHLGVTTRQGDERAMLRKDDGTLEGAVRADGKVSGCYVHGLFAKDDFRRDFIARLGGVSSSLSYERTVENALDEIAGVLDVVLDVDGLRRISEA